MPGPWIAFYLLALLPAAILGHLPTQGTTSRQPADSINAIDAHSVAIQHTESTEPYHTNDLKASSASAILQQHHVRPSDSSSSCSSDTATGSSDTATGSRPSVISHQQSANGHGQFKFGAATSRQLPSGAHHTSHHVNMDPVTTIPGDPRQSRKLPTAAFRRVSTHGAATLVPQTRRAMLTSMAASPRHLLGVAPCVLNSTTYHPSQLERLWVANIREWGSNVTGLLTYCEHVNATLAAIAMALGVVKRLMSTTGDTRTTTGEYKVVSHFTYEYDCAGEQHFHRVAIEPLVGFLRHPLALCKGSAGVGSRKYLISKKYMLLASAYKAPIFHSRTAKAFIFDLGASLYTEGAGGASQQWFVETLRRRGFKLDTYYGWEATKKSDDLIYAQVPAWLQSRYMYYNFLAPTGVDDHGNPLNILRRVATREDYVVLKIDIDNSVVELEFIRQLLADSSLAALVDEFFFEHHVNFPPMFSDWHTESVEQQLGDSYALFTRLRKLGIRAHGWV